AKRSAIREGVAGAQARMLMVTDSWGEMTDVPGGLAYALAGGTANLAGDGWRPMRNGGSLTGATTSASAGWTSVDASTTTTWPSGLGPGGGPSVSYTQLT
ncbi:hypothetical protein DV959_13430, partial [Staphylococcus pseudintermedius]